MRRGLPGAGLLLSLAMLASCGGSGASPTLEVSTPAPTQHTTAATPPTPHITTITGTGAPTAGPTPAWSKIALPSGFGLQFHLSDVEPAPSDGNIAYACAPLPATPPNQAYAIATTNTGATFGMKAQVGSGWGSCAQIVVDEAQPSRAIAYQDFGLQGVITTDGGASWQAYNGPYLREMVTARGTTYGIQEDTSSSPAAFTLVASSDGLKTWRTIAIPLPTMDTQVLRLWAQPAGNLLVQTSSHTYPYPVGMLRSTDGGATWTSMSLPSKTLDGSSVNVTTGANGAWNICGMYNTSNTDATVNVTCTSNSGATWTLLPQLGTQGQSSLQLAGLRSDGAVVATEVTGSAIVLYRWLPGATTWQSLGALPPSTAWTAYYPTPSGGVLWAFVAESDGAGYPGPANAIYSAPYPAS